MIANPRILSVLSVAFIPQDAVGREIVRVAGDVQFIICFAVAVEGETHTHHLPRRREL
jgi:hypothetical protein